MTTLKPPKTSIAQSIVDAILLRELQPGDRLGEQELGDRFGVSRTLVREALMELQARGFLEVRTRSGWYVVEPSFQEACETYEARKVVEPGMLLNAGKPLQSVVSALRQHIEAEKRAIRTDDAAQRSVLLADFHVCLAEHLGNRFLSSMITDLTARTTLISTLYQSPDEALDSNDDHAQIVSAMEAGNLQLASDLMMEHIKRLEARLSQKLKAAQAAS